MLIKEFTGEPSSDYSLSHAVVFHDELNPKLFDSDGQMHPNIRKGLLEIAEHFKDFIGVELDIQDITVSGSNAAYSYTPYSDLDLHLVVNVPDDPAFKEMLDAKKNVYNAQHDIRVKGIDVELYAQDAAQEHHSQGIYSVSNDAWISKPERVEMDIDQGDVRDKYKNYRDRIRAVIKQDDLDQAREMWNDVKRMRKAGLSRTGEFGAENLAYKMLRNQSWIERLQQHIRQLEDQRLSIEQRAGL
jgi:hypothetical protein